MIIHHSNQLLEQLSELESKIQLIEKIVLELNIDCDQEKLLKALLARRLSQSSGPQG